MMLSILLFKLSILLSIIVLSYFFYLELSKEKMSIQINTLKLRSSIAKLLLVMFAISPVALFGQDNCHKYYLGNKPNFEIETTKLLTYMWSDQDSAYINTQKINLSTVFKVYEEGLSEFFVIQQGSGYTYCLSCERQQDNREVLTNVRMLCRDDKDDLVYIVFYYDKYVNMYADYDKKQGIFKSWFLIQ
jgi:hypothetical protein